MRFLSRLILIVLLVFPTALLLGDGPRGSIAMAQDATEDEEALEDTIVEDEDDEAEIEEDETTDLAEEKEEDLSGEPEASPSADTTILFVKGEEPMGGRPFGLVINLNYKDLNGNVFQDAVFNQTVTIIEREDGLDGETIFMYMFLAGLGLLVVVGLHQLLESRKRKRPAQKVEMGTSNQNDVDMSWIPQETLNQINKASPRRLPRKRAQKRSVGSDE
ncbi:translocon-associated protein subunit alpha isoform X3 [Gracilinanus agilis]|uniref:translocon-associated protein subunit alpha isoform X3 n=1 Tax=Gracilinanus agilis TaxID=191870 RepID=UPI001CFE93B5|nr:translocon-associated protein subunit alpha isoform X3 [Gracilinanus agilis]